MSIRYCSRCKESVPLTEWKLLTHSAPPSGMAWRHEGELRGYSPDPPIECGFVMQVPRIMESSDANT